MGLGDLYRKRYRRRQRRQMLVIMALLVVVAAMLVGVRACSDQVNQDLQGIFNPLDNKNLEQKLRDKFQQKLEQRLGNSR